MLPGILTDCDWFSSRRIAQLETYISLCCMSTEADRQCAKQLLIDFSAPDD